MDCCVDEIDDEERVRKLPRLLWEIAIMSLAGGKGDGLLPWDFGKCHGETVPFIAATTQKVASMPAEAEENGWELKGSNGEPHSHRHRDIILNHRQRHNVQDRAKQPYPSTLTSPTL